MHGVGSITLNARYVCV